MLYFDHAATSSPKPQSVADTIANYLKSESVTAGRGNYTAAGEIARLLTQTRNLVAQFFGAQQPEKVIFCHSGTDALNTAIFGYIKPSMKVLSTCLEHNSVLRPLFHLKETRQISLSLLNPQPGGMINLDEATQKIQRENIDVLVCTHASNVTGVIQPIDELGKICREHGTKFIVDAAQTSGHIKIDMNESKIDLLATSAHKGLLGPLGTGLLILGDISPLELTPFRFGGTGANSESPYQPESLPERFEAGNLNVPGILGLKAALEKLNEETNEIHRLREMNLLDHLLTALRKITSLHILENNVELSRRIGVISLLSDFYDPQTLAQILDTEFDIAVRAGLHCAPLCHQHYQTTLNGGTLRISLGWQTTSEDIDKLLEALSNMHAI